MFDDLESRARYWLELEQTVNERTYRDSTHGVIDIQKHALSLAHRPESRSVWPLEAVWIPRDRVRVYGSIHSTVFGNSYPDDRIPLVLHPRPPAPHRRLVQTFGAKSLDGICATPTSSYRSVLAWRRDHPPVILKLSLGAVVAGVRRTLTEREIAGSVLMSRVLATIPAVDRRRLNFDWFTEPGGVAETSSQSGWLLRVLPESKRLVPAFSLISASGDRAPILVEMIRESGLSAEAFVIERILQRYVSVLGYLLFEQGIQVEGHCQNVLFEIDRNGLLTGRLVLRDLSDMTLSIPFRLARRKPFPPLDRNFVTGSPPFALATVSADHKWNQGRSSIYRGRDTVERYGLGAFVGAINVSLQRYFKRYAAMKVEHEYLQLWQKQAMRYLNLRPLFRKKPKGIATDEACAYWLREVDWTRLRAMSGARLPSSAEPLYIVRRMPRRAGAVYDRVECPWGDIFLEAGLPAFFSPAF